MSLFYFGAALSVAIFLLFALYPWLLKSAPKPVNTVTNQGLIKQRIDELNTELQQGLLSGEDKQAAENELKIALLDEIKTNESNDSKSSLPLMLAALISLSVGITVYFYSNQIQQIQQWQVAEQQTSELGKRMLKGDESLNLQDLQHFALGLRTKLRETPEDATGWMLLGRVSGAMNRVDSAIQAFEKSLKYAPDNVGTLSSYAQALLMTGQEQQVLHAKKVLLHILGLEPDNTNAMGVLAIVATELGDKALALSNWQRLIAFIPETDPNYGAVQQRISQLSIELGRTEKLPIENAATTRVAVTVNIAKELQSKLPEKGVLFVFAQESTGKVRMPAAVVKMSLREFPVVVELSNDNAMMANYTLSQLQQAKLVARISLDENVAESSGELQGEMVVTLEQNQTIQQTILIDREL
mgnify:FL=1